MIIAIASLGLAIAGLVGAALSSATSDFDADGALLVGYIGTLAALAWGFVGVCLAVVNLYDHAGVEPKSRVAIILLVMAIVCSVISLVTLHLRGLLG